MFDFKNKNYWRRFFVMVFGIVIMGCGVCLFKLSLMGNDPHSAMTLAVADFVKHPFSITLIVINSLWFVLQFFLGRHLIGIGTFFNWFCVGLFSDLFTECITKIFVLPSDFVGRLIIMTIGIIVLSLSCALYQTANLGVSPYDSISIMMDERLPLPYFWCRIITDSFCSVVAILFGGLVGLGTIICAFALGPFVSFFSNTVAQKLCNGK